MERIAEPMSLILPGEELEFTSREFLGPTKPFFGEGQVRLYGSRGWQYDETETGLAIINNRIVVRPAMELTRMVWEHNFYAVDVNLSGVPEPPFFMVCRMSLPEHQLYLDSTLDFDVDDVEKQWLCKYKAMTFRWGYPSDAERFIFFASPEIVDLSKLTFEFFRREEVESNCLIANGLLN